jgi:hypothetical protein
VVWILEYEDEDEDKNFMLPIVLVLLLVLVLGCFPIRFITEMAVYYAARGPPVAAA